MKKQTTIKELEWIRTYHGYLSISKIEKELHMPATTLHRFAKGERGLDEQWHERVISWVKKFKQ